MKAATLSLVMLAGSLTAATPSLAGDVLEDCPGYTESSNIVVNQVNVGECTISHDSDAPRLGFWATFSTTSSVQCFSDDGVAIGEAVEETESLTKRFSNRPIRNTTIQIERAAIARAGGKQAWNELSKKEKDTRWAEELRTFQLIALGFKLEDCANHQIQVQSEPESHYFRVTKF